MPRPLTAGFLAAAVVGFAAIAWLLLYLRTRPLYPFAVYCVLAGTVSLLVGLLRG